MDRRTYLTSLSAGLAGVAGCMRLAGSRTDTETSAETPTETEEVKVRIETLTMKLEIPWGAAFHPETRNLYVTERPGRVRRLTRGEDDRLANGERDLVADLTAAVEHEGEGGLLGLAFHPDDPGTAYTYQTAASRDGLVNRIVRHDVEAGFAVDEIVLDGIPAGRIRNGGRLLVGPDDALYATTGDAGDPAAAADGSSLAGKVLRLTLDGEPHPRNPTGTAVYSSGHRNPQGLAFHPETGDLYGTEHGPDEGDEINVLRAGNDYGWSETPNAGGSGVDPIRTYAPTVAPASATFYEGTIEEWRGDLFFGALAGRQLHRVRIDPTERRVEEEQTLLTDEYGRLRTVFGGPDDDLYVLTSNRDGRGTPAPQDDRLLRIHPA